jgi:hypothetical protein
MKIADLHPIRKIQIFLTAECSKHLPVTSFGQNPPAKSRKARKALPSVS